MKPEKQEFKNCIQSFHLPGPAGGPEGHPGLSESHWGSAGSKGNHLPGRAEAPGGGQPAVWLRLAGDAEPCHPAGEEGEKWESLLQKLNIILGLFASFLSTGKITLKLNELIVNGPSTPVMMPTDYGALRPAKSFFFFCTFSFMQIFHEMWKEKKQGSWTISKVLNRNIGWHWILIGCCRLWRQSTQRRKVSWSIKRRQQNTQQRLDAWSSWRKNSNAPSTSQSKSWAEFNGTLTYLLLFGEF